MTLSREQIELFHNNGFLKLPGVLPSKLVDELKQTTLQNMNDAIEPVVRDEQDRVMRISQIWQRQPVYQQAATHDTILDPLEDILGPSIVLTRNRHNHATLNHAGMRGVYWHRDIQSWTRNIVTVIIYIEESTIDNGCTQVIPGTHKLPWAHDVGVSDLTENETISATGVFEQGVAVPMPAGGLVVINSLIFHRIGDNRTDGSRISCTFGYHGMDELYGEGNPQAALVRGKPQYTGNVEY